MDLSGKRVVLTGASSGIGRAMLPLLYKKGAVVLGAGLDAFDPGLPSVNYIQADLSQRAEIDAVFEAAEQILGGIDIFIANAGFAYYGGADEADSAHTEKIFATNVLSPLYAFHKLKVLKGDSPFQFAVTASAMSFLPIPGYALYSATKHAVQGFFETARYELPNQQVITLMHPIATRTAFFSSGAPVPFPSQTAEHVARRYIRGIERNKAHIYPSKLFVVVKHLTLLGCLEKKIELRRFEKWRTERGEHVNAENV